MESSTDVSKTSGESLLGAAARPFSLRGLTLSAVSAAPMLLAPIGGEGALSLVAGAALSVLYLLALTHVMAGRPGFVGAGRGAAVGPRRGEEARATASRAFALYLAAVLPFVGVVAAARGPLDLSPVDVLGAMLVTSLYMPAAITAVVASGRAATAFWPFAWMRVIGALGPPVHARLTLTFALSTAAVWAVSRAGAQANDLYLPTGSALGAAASAFARTTLEGLVWLAQACAMGALLARRRRALGLT